MTPEQELKKENKFLKKVILAQQRLLIAYRVGSVQVPEWVFNTLDKAKEQGIL